MISLSVTDEQAGDSQYALNNKLSIEEISISMSD